MSMHIQSAFKVNAPPQEAWRLLTNLERVAPCFPGAELGEALGDGMYRANFKVKLGPVSLTFAGKVGFVELHEDLGLALIKASGSDTKGRGGAQGTVRCQLAADGGATTVALDSSVDLSGSVAQYGRGQGMITDLTQQLVTRFALNLEALTAPPAPSETAPVASSPKAPKPARAAAQEAEVGGLLAGALWRAVLRFLARLLGRAR
jgi:carbon monoxide dehydrogenase subunit G